MRRTDTQISNGHSWRLTSWRWWEDATVVEWRRTIVDQIEAIRLAEAPALCPACGSTADASALESKWCPSCEQWLSIRLFGRAKNEREGILWECRPCRAKRSKRYRSQRARRGQLPLMEVAS